VRGVVFDSLAGAPLAAATVQIAPADAPERVRTTFADSLGRYAFDTLPAGRWVAVFYHAGVEVLGVELPPRVVEVRSGGVTTLALGVDGGATLHRALCPSSRPDSTGAVLGVAHDGEESRPLDGATVTIAWDEIVLRKGAIQGAARRVPAAVRPGGMFLFCGVPTDAPLVMRAESPGLESGEVHLSARAGSLVRRDLTLGRVRATGARDAAGLRRLASDGARVAGRVLDDGGRPLPNARVVVLGAAGRGVTDDHGAFRLDGLPTGTWMVEARAIGFAPTRAVVTLSRDAPADVGIRMARPAQSLGRVVVRGQASPRERFLEDFLQRRQRSSGIFLPPEELDRRRPARVSDLFRTLPGFTLSRSETGSGFVLRGRAGCTPAVYVDGVAIQRGADDLDDVLGADDVLAVEVYRGAEAPPQFSAIESADCASVVVWMKR
jgi:hypothetical protein